ncbi:MAG TPA: UPF0182 family protein [Pyrinomonadaceae bacterium]|jgi:hypothetical protein|nr:UPF0182 family protein [Pyrinomonadaceae bacterium]
MSSRPREPEVIDVGPPKRRRLKIWIFVAAVLLLLSFSRIVSIYVSALWFGSLGYSSVYWYIFKVKLALFVGSAVITAALLSATFLLFQKLFGALAFEKRTIILNNQPFQFSPAKIIRPLGWIISALFGLIFGFRLKEHWRQFALFWNQPATSLSDPIFGKSLGFYLFSLPLYDLLNSWLLGVTFIILCAAIAYSLLGLPQTVLKPSVRWSSGAAFRGVCCALALFLLMISWRTYLSRFPFLWEDHATFSGVTYTEAHYTLPALLILCVVLIIAAVILVINAFSVRRFSLLLIALALPVATYVIGIVLVPTYIQSFVVKPNELDRETPYIGYNLEWTRKAFGLDQIELRDFEAENSVAALDLPNNRQSLENIRLWDWRALQDTLRQIQAIRTYYDFPDVDVDRYSMSGQTRQMMIAPREINDEKLPASSRNWVNERLTYTHGYGVTMNSANGFTPEGLPQFVASNMPIEGEVKVTRPEIYFGELTNRYVYVKTKQQEFDYPQGDTNATTTYQGTGGIPIGNRLRRMLLAWGVGDLSRLPFSDAVTSDSRVLINRNIREIVNGVAPFLTYDNDPYIVVSNDGRLFWMIDAFTESSYFPYSTHHDVAGNSLNYIRNSVKVVIDAYNGTASFYVFDNQDPLLAAYRRIFPNLFQDATQMPADLRAHVRYPETLIRAQGEVYSLYHTQNPKVFFQREDVWSIAQHIKVNDQKEKESEPIDPYFVLMQLPGEQQTNEFVIILPFTPASRNNMIGWMAGRSDGEHYGKLLVYNFPKSRLIDGPVQIEARIDQNAQLSGQFTLWNQQGSRVIRGHLLVIPIGRSLMFVEPIYLQAERSPMPELRLVVLATQEKLGYGQSFNEAMSNLFGEATAKATATPQPGQDQAPQQPSPSATPAADLQQLVNRAIQEFDDYQRLTSQGKLGEAGQKLEQHKRTLEEIKQKTNPR